MSKINLSPNFDLNLHKMGACCVVNCSNNGTRDGKRLKFFRFPKKNEEQRLLWIQAINRTKSDGKPWLPTDYTRICSEHFVGGMLSRTMNNPAYVPSIFPEKKSSDKKCRVTVARHYDNR